MALTATMAISVERGIILLILLSAKGVRGLVEGGVH